MGTLHLAINEEQVETLSFTLKEAERDDTRERKEKSDLIH